MDNYRLDAYDTNGIRQFIITDSLNASCIRRVNAPGILTFSINGFHPLLSSIADKWQIELWIKLSGQTWYREFAGLFRYGEWEHKDTYRFTGRCIGIMSLLSWRHVAWYAETNNRSQFTGVKAETIMKTLVDYNAAANATTVNGRRRDGAITGLTVEADGAHGNILNWNCAYDNLLKTLQGLSKIAGGDFDLVKTSSTAWQFRWYTGQLGTDKSSTVKFSLKLGNMSNAVYVDDRAEESTVAIVGGQKEAADREIAIRTGANYDVSSNNIETFVDARNVKTIEGLNAVGDQELKEIQAKRSFYFEVLQAPQTIYGVHYGLGDLVSVINPFTGAIYIQKVWSATTTLSPNEARKVGVELGVP